MNVSLVLILAILAVIVSVESQLNPSGTSPRRSMFARPGQRRGPVPPSRLGSFRTGSRRTRPPGSKPPAGIAKKLNDATDFRALARVLLRQ